MGCVALKKACAKKKDCDALLKMDSIKATEKAGCGKSKDLLDEWFAITSECPNTKYPGFQDSATAPVASKVYATGKWSIPKDGYKGDMIETDKPKAPKRPFRRIKRHMLKGRL